MAISESQKQALIDSIIGYELEMFLAVQNVDGPAACQQRPESFKAMRWMTHSVFPCKYLESYLEDLKTAKGQGINFMTIKYGRMDNLIPRYSSNPLIDYIADIEVKWMKELRRTAPKNFQSSSTEGFRLYLSCELETLSDKTLDIYKEFVDQADREGRNLAVERYDNLQKRLKSS